MRTQLVYVDCGLWGCRLLLSGKVAFVKGAISKLGNEVATKFIKQGATVILADKMPSDCKTIAETLNKNTAANAEAIEHDVSDPVMFRKAIEDVKGRHGRLDIFFNHAEVNHVSTNDTGIFKDTMAANVQSVLECIRHAGDVMRGNPDGGCVLCTSSNMVLLADVVPSAYSISQTALIGVIRAKAAELASDGVRVNAISPASVDLRVLRSIFPKASPTQLTEMIDNYMAKPANDGDVANAAVYLASDYGKSVTGQNLVLNGEFTAGPGGYSRL